VGFTRAQLEAFRDREVDDLLGPELRLLFVGINPGLWTAAVNTHFAHPGNRFYPALTQAGIIELAVDRSAGMTETERDHLRRRGIGITNLVKRATVRADELSREELLVGGERLLALVAQRRPKVVAIAGVTAFRQAASRRRRSSRIAGRARRCGWSPTRAVSTRTRRWRVWPPPTRPPRSRPASSPPPDRRFRNKSGRGKPPRLWALRSMDTPRRPAHLVVTTAMNSDQRQPRRRRTISSIIHHAEGLTSVYETEYFTSSLLGQLWEGRASGVTRTR
jgi:TDG/mug DNA glycosylase family protein